MALTAKVLSRPGLIPAMAPLSKLMPSLRRQFRDARLAQLFGRYATYVGGSLSCPALLGLIWRSEAGGVWRVKGGMHRLAHALADLVKRQGGEIHLRTGAARIEVQGGRVAAVITDTGDRIATRHVVFNGDPQALGRGALGPAARNLLPPQAVPAACLPMSGAFPLCPRARAHPSQRIFGNDPRTEFDALHANKMPVIPPCTSAPKTVPAAAPRRGMGAEIIMNGPPSVPQSTDSEETTMSDQNFSSLAQWSTFSPAPAGQPGGTELTTPADFARLFPASDGSPWAESTRDDVSLARPTAQTRLPGLILAGGGHIRSGDPDGDPFREARGRNDLEGPCFDIAVLPNCHAWWYIDGISDNGGRAISIIGFAGSVFSSWYRWSDAKPRQSLLHQRGHLWARRPLDDDRPRRTGAAAVPEQRGGPSKMVWKTG